MNKKQTAVEWMIGQLEGEDSKIARVIGLKKYNEIVSQAKAMDRQQALDLIKLTAQLTGVATVDKEIAKMEMEDVYNQYFTETYGENEKTN